MIFACTVLLYNRIHMEGWKPCANHGLVCTLENFQWCGEPCFIGAAIARARCLLLIPRWDKHKSLSIWSVLYTAGTSLPRCSLAATICSCLLEVCSLAANVVSLPVLRLLPSNCFTRNSTYYKQHWRSYLISPSHLSCLMSSDVVLFHILISSLSSSISLP
jgi:hypothetical protein